MKERGSDGSYASSTSSSSSAEGPESLEGQGVEPTLSDTGPVPLLTHRLMFYALFHSGYDSAYECVVSNHTYGRRTFSAVCLTGVDMRSRM